MEARRGSVCSFSLENGLIKRVLQSDFSPLSSVRDCQVYLLRLLILLSLGVICSLDVGISSVSGQWLNRRLAPAGVAAPVMNARFAGASRAPIVTSNFEVTAPDGRLAQRIAELAETYRRDLALEWLGHELPTWQQRCPIEVEIQPLAGGETSFAFVQNGSRSEPVEWQMKLYGPPERILDSVLPHEITHTIFATHFGRPLPRWADEGACTTVEHESERAKNHQMLMEFLSQKPSRGIPFNRMFLMRDYPHDILPLYAQGYSVARFLMRDGDRRKFIDFVATGLAAERPGQELAAWDQATHQFYGFADLSELQVQWLSWVKAGCPATPSGGTKDAVAMSSSSDPVHSASSSLGSIDKGRELESNRSENIGTLNLPRQLGSGDAGMSVATGTGARSVYLGRAAAPNQPPVVTAEVSGYFPGSTAGYDTNLWQQWNAGSLISMKQVWSGVSPAPDQAQGIVTRKQESEAPGQSTQKLWR